MDKTHIIIHHSATTDGPGEDWEAIRRYHMSYRIDGVSVSPEEFERRRAAGQGVKFEKPWSDIGYHLGIERVNGELVVQAGRPMDRDGAHCPQLGMNKVGIGLCVVGNFDEEVPTLELRRTLFDLVLGLMERFGIPPERVLGHREVQAMAGVLPQLRKTCPGRLWDMNEVRKTLTERRRIWNSTTCAK